MFCLFVDCLQYSFDFDTCSMSILEDLNMSFCNLIFSTYFLPSYPV